MKNVNKPPWRCKIGIRSNLNQSEQFLCDDPNESACHCVWHNLGKKFVKLKINSQKSQEAWFFTSWRKIIMQCNIPTMILSKVKASAKLANPRRRLNPMLWYTWATCCNNRTKVISLNDGKYCCKTDISSDPSINFNVVSTFEQSFKGWNSTSK